MENGITIGLGNNIDGKCMDWHNFDVITVDDIKRKIIVYAFGKPSIWTEIFSFQGKRNEFVIKSVKYNKSNNTYSIYFNDNINNIDKNWYERINDTFVKRPLISQYENIKIHVKNKQIKFKQQSIQDFKSLEKMCDFMEKYKGNKFDITNFAIKIDMMQQQNMKRLKQILVGTQDLVNKIENERHLEKYLQHLKIMKIEEVKQGSKNEYNLDSVRNISNTKIQHVEDAINQCEVMIDQLKQNTIKIDKYNENMLENVFLGVENKCERIEIMQGKFSQMSESICDIVQQVQRIIEYDWKEDNINIFKQWEKKLIEQLQIIIKIINVNNGVSNCDLSDEMKIGVFNDEYLFTIRLNRIGDLTGDEFRSQVYGNSGVCLYSDSKSFSSISSSSLSLNSLSSLSTTDDKSEINENITNGKFSSDISNGCRFWFFVIDDGG